MKKFFLILLAIVLPMVANAERVGIDGIYYNLDAELKTAEVTNKSSYYSGSLAIPEKVQYDEVTYNVTSIGLKAFYRCAGLTSITIPSSVKFKCLMLSMT